MLAGSSEGRRRYGGLSMLQQPEESWLSADPAGRTIYWMALVGYRQADIRYWWCLTGLSDFAMNCSHKTHVITGCSRCTCTLSGQHT